MARPPRVCSQYNFDVARRIVELRAAAGFSQAQFAKRIGISQAQWSRTETGKVQLNVNHLFRVAMALKIEPHHILENLE